MTLKVWQIQLLGILVLSLLFSFAIPSFASRIPEALQQSLTERLKEKGYDWVNVSVKGRNIRLHGNAPSAEKYASALELVEQYTPIARINNQMTPRIIQPYTMRMQWDGKLVKLTGYVPQQNDIQTLLKVGYQYLGKEKIRSEIKLGIGAPKQWQQIIATSLEGLLKLQQGQVEITNQRIYFSGQTLFSKRRNDISQALTAFKHYQSEIHIVAADEAEQICQAKFKQLLNNTNIEFMAGKATLNKSSYPLLKKLSVTAALCSHAQISIEGYTDDRGSDESNMKLSQLRSQAVVNWLFQQGIPESQLTAVGYGKENPIADNSTEEGRAKNRRIEFAVKGRR